MEDLFNKLADAVAAPRRPKRIADIRKYFALYSQSRNMESYESSPVVVYLGVGFLFAGIVVLGLWSLGVITILK